MSKNITPGFQPCLLCYGATKKNLDMPNTGKCRYCAGKGESMQDQSVIQGGQATIAQRMTPCRMCNATGHCTRCKGTGQTDGPNEPPACCSIL